MSTNQIAWVDCEHPGCDNGLVIDRRHLTNFDGRDWYCRNHDSEPPC